MSKDYYKILALSPDAKPAQVKQNAQTILNKTKNEYLTNLQEIKQAYSVIANPKYRKDYDSKSNIRHYQVLRIGIDTEPNLLKSLVQNTVNVLKKEYKNKISEIKEAYSVLGNLEQKASYDDAIFQREYKKSQEKLKHLQTAQAQERKLLLTKMFFSLFFIGLFYFGYNKYQDTILVQDTAVSKIITWFKMILLF